jgi:hypothetical protein
MKAQENLPDPFVPAEANLRDFPFMPIDIARLFGSGFHATASDSEWRAGVTLWLKSFHQVPAGSLPDDDVELCRLAEFGRDMKTWKKVKVGALRGWVLCSDGRLYHATVAEKVNEAWKKKEMQRERSKRGNEARWGNRDATSNEPPRGNGAKGRRKDHVGDHDAIPKGLPEGVQEAIPQGMQEGVPEPSFNDPKGQGQGEGEGEELIRQARSLPQSGAPPSRPGGELHAKCIKLVAKEPVACAQDFHVIEAMIGDLITPADVLEGIRTGRRRSTYRFRAWGKFEGWIRGAAQDRLGRIPRTAAPAEDPERPRENEADPEIALVDSLGKPTSSKWRKSQIVAMLERWKETGEWRAQCPPPDRHGCQFPRWIIEECGIAVRGKLEAAQ